MLIANNRRNERTAAQVAEFWGKSLDKRDWYNISDQGGNKAELLIYDVIGWPWIEAADLVRELAMIDADEITVRINSPGGDVFDGLAIHHALVQHPAKIITVNEGLAASIASIIYMAGDERRNIQAGHVMIHRAWTIAVINSVEAATMADLLDRTDRSLAGIYASRTGKPLNKILEMMTAETWFIGDEATDAGFADAIINSNPAQIAAGITPDIFSHAPESLHAILTGGDQDEPTKRKIERALRDAGLNQQEAKGVLAGGWAAKDQRDVDNAELLASVNAITNKFKK